MKLIPYGRQFITDEDIKAVNSVLRSDYITTGPVAQEFEKKLAKTFGSKYAVVYNSGTSALHGAYFALGLDVGSEFITSSNTFVATGNAGLYLGFKPVFCDIEEDTGNIDVGIIEDKVTRKTNFIVPVHYGGHPADLESIAKIAGKHDLKIIEDASHAVGAKYKNTRIGDCTYSDMTVFSFHPVKHITTGEGGAVLTNNEEFYSKLIMFRSHGITKENLNNTSEGDWYYEMHYLGHNYRMTDFQAALGRSQLDRLENNILRRREIAAIYKQAFKNYPYFFIPPERDYAQSSYHLYPIRLKDHLIPRRKEIFQNLRNIKLGVQTHYIPVYQQPFYQKNGYNKIHCPVAEKFYQSEISIPMYPSLTNEEIDQVIDRIDNVFGHNR